MIFAIRRFGARSRPLVHSPGRRFVPAECTSWSILVCNGHRLSFEEADIVR